LYTIALPLGPPLTSPMFPPLFPSMRRLLLHCSPFQVCETVFESEFFSLPRGKYLLPAPKFWSLQGVVQVRPLCLTGFLDGLESSDFWTPFPLFGTPNPGCGPFFPRRTISKLLPGCPRPCLAVCKCDCQSRRLIRKFLTTEKRIAPYTRDWFDRAHYGVENRVFFFFFLLSPPAKSSFRF